MAKSNEGMVHSLNNQNKSSKITIANFLIMLVLAGALGGAVGFFVTTIVPAQSAQTATRETKQTAAKNSAGVLDEKKFPDEAEGMLKEGGVEGEGSFHLERPGGESQNVYLTSSTVDLSQYVNKKVKVRGQTQQAQKAGWLMDVGYIEIL